jgi:hypothetical protein
MDRQLREQNIVALTPMLGQDTLPMQAIARSLHRLDEANCNVGLTEAQEKRAENLDDRAEALARLHGLAVYVQGDPRGWPLYLYDPKHPKLEKYPIQSVYSSISTAVCPF